MGKTDSDTKEPQELDSTDQLTTYFRQLAEHDLLSPESEQALSENLEEIEVQAWELILSRPELVEPILAMIEPNLEQPVPFTRLLSVVDKMSTQRAKKNKKLVKKLGLAARRVAVALRAVDLDRLHIDAVIRELCKEDSWWDDRSTPEGKLFLNDVCKVHRSAAMMREEFVKANLRLVVKMARRYDRGGMLLSDLIQEGNLGLIHAVSRFDYRRGLRFSTYACWWIRHAIGRALADKSRAVRIPVHMLEAQHAIEKIRQELMGDLGRPPVPQEIADAANIPVTKLNQMNHYIMGQPLSLDRPVHDDDDRSFGDTITDPDSDECPTESMTTKLLTDQLSKLLHLLTPIEADVITKRFGLGDDEERTFREIGVLHNLSRERIRQIQNTALDKLKRALEREHRGVIEL